MGQSHSDCARAFLVLLHFLHGDFEFPDRLFRGFSGVIYGLCSALGYIEFLFIFLFYCECYFSFSISSCIFQIAVALRAIFFFVYV